MSVQDAVKFSSCKSSQFDPSNTDIRSTTDAEILRSSEDTLDSNINIYITLKRYTQNLSVNTGVKDLDIDL